MERRLGLRLSCLCRGQRGADTGVTAPEVEGGGEEMKEVGQREHAQRGLIQAEWDTDRGI